MQDNLCDHCQCEMSIKRNAKGSRYLRCVNPNCVRGARNLSDQTPKVEVPIAAPITNSTPASSRRVFGFSL